MNIDQLLFASINNLAGKFPILDNSAIFFAEYAPYFLIIIVIFFLINNFKKYKKMAAYAFFSSFTAKFLVSEIIRFFYSKPRPFVGGSANLLINKIATPAFPSGHASFFFAIATIIYMRNKKLGILSFLLCVLMGISRVYVGVHWPADIIGGAFVGIASAIIIYYFSPRFFAILKKLLPRLG